MDPKFKVGDYVWYRCFWCEELTVEGKIIIVGGEGKYLVSCRKGHTGTYHRRELLEPKFKVGDAVALIFCPMPMGIIRKCLPDDRYRIEFPYTEFIEEGRGIVLMERDKTDDSS